MKEDFVTIEIAKKLKEKGFDWETIEVYERNIIACQYEDYPKPSISQVLKWLREEKNLHIEIVSAAYGYIYIVSDTPNKGGTDRVSSRYRGNNDAGAWDDYNECVFDAIEYVIDNLI